MESDSALDISFENGEASTTSETTDHMTKVGVISVDPRVKRKAKRLLKQHSKESAGESSVKVGRNWKNSRKPRNGYRRGLPKKGGAGRKGVWGLPGIESEGIEDTDENDPNYDSDSVDNGDVELKSVIPELSDDDLRKNIELIILEYYEHGDSGEALVSFDELNYDQSKKYMIPLQAIEMALDHKPSHREMTSVLLCDLTPCFLKPKIVGQAFSTLLGNLPDLILDLPDAPVVLGNFIARAVADACIPVAAIQTLKNSNGNDHAREALSRAETLLSVDNGLYRLDNVWGIGGGLRPVKTLIRQMNLLLEEFISSVDVQEATRCLLELEVPHFHHELVYEAIVFTLESLNSEVETSMCTLLKSLSDAIIITPDMMHRGFLRVYEDMPDIILDVPLAYTVLERFVDQCCKAGFISEEIARKVPIRGRKRFVSEGDGGRVKEHY